MISIQYFGSNHSSFSPPYAFPYKACCTCYKTNDNCQQTLFSHSFQYRTFAIPINHLNQLVQIPCFVLIKFIIEVLPYNLHDVGKKIIPSIMKIRNLFFSFR